MTLQKSYREGRVSATVWENKKKNPKEGEDEIFFSYTIDKNYVDDKGEWQKSNSFTMDDVRKLQAVLSRIVSDNVSVRGSTQDSED
jgi:hypothetical protein